MKFGYFSHVWGRPGITPAERYQELWREIALADETGFDYAFSVEHHFSPQESWMPSPAIFCAGAAVCTKQIRVGAMGYVAGLHNPIQITEEVAALDQVLDGRLEVGITSGLTPGFFEPYGANFDERKPRARECVELMRAAFGPDDQFDFDGEFHSYRDLSLAVQPVQRPHPPVWVPTGDRRTLRWLASIGAHTSSTMVVPRRALSVLHGHFLDWWGQAGHAEQPNIGYWAPVYVAETDEEAIRRGGPHIVHTLAKTLLGVPGGVAPLPEQEQQKLSKSGTVGSEGLSTEVILANAGDINFLLDHNLVFLGSPDTVVEQIRAAAAEGSFNTVLGEFNLGLMAEDELHDSIRLFGTAVAPALRSYQPY
jgi:alkanesulfonate monooxygenase SsuD/methylene tetrahydromethanopterin reductase-like flavin-dependent oxidoreductase (luciferase family)